VELLASHLASHQRYTTSQKALIAQQAWLDAMLPMPNACLRFD
jgi:hypothetical protein